MRGLGCINLIELKFRPSLIFNFCRSDKRCGGMKHAVHRQETRGGGDGIVVENSVSRICHRDQQVSQTDRVFFNIAEF